MNIEQSKKNNRSDFFLDERLFRRAANQVTLDPSESLTLSNSSNSAYSGNQPAGPSSNTDVIATTVAPGGIIDSVILRTSSSDDRVEMTPDDNLTAYNSANPHIQINRNGILVIQPDGTIQLNIKYDGFYFPQSDISTYDNGDAVFKYTDTPSTIIYEATGYFPAETDVGVFNLRGEHFPDGILTNGVYQGIYYRGAVAGASGTKLFGTGGVTTSRVSTGVNDLRIVTPPTAASVSCVVTAISGHFRGKCVYNAGTSTMRVTFQQSDYGSQSFGVSGGGGGSVTVSGIYQGEAPVDTDFYFVMTRSTN